MARIALQMEVSHSSPATVVLEARPIYPNSPPPFLDRSAIVGTSFVETLSAMETGAIPAGIDAPLLESFRNLARPIGHRVARMTVVADDSSLKISPGLARKIDVALNDVETFHGRVDGRLERLNIHHRANLFVIYPLSGPRKINCRFRDEHRELVRRGVDRRVAVEGDLRYLRAADFPHEIRVDSIEVFPPEDELPRLSDLRGHARTLDERPTEVQIREVRDAWE